MQTIPNDKYIAGLRQELKDLEEALARQNPPLDSRTRDIAKAKIAKLQRQIKEIPENQQNKPKARMSAGSDGMGT